MILKAYNCSGEVQIPLESLTSRMWKVNSSIIDDINKYFTTEQLGFGLGFRKKQLDGGRRRKSRKRKSKRRK